LRCSDRLLDPPVQFLLRSEQVNETSAALAPSNQQNPSTSTPVDNQSRNLNRNSLSSKLAGLTKSVNAEKKRKRKVAFADEPDSGHDIFQKAKPDSQYGTSEPESTLDLAAIKGVCAFLRQNCNLKGKAKAYPAYIAHLRHSAEARYVFYLSSKSYPVHGPVPKTSFQQISLIEYLRTQFQETVSVVLQYKLALQLTRAVLHFHSTPWFGDEWGIGQLSVIQGSEEQREDIPLYVNSALAPVKVEGTLPGTAHDPAVRENCIINSVKVPLSAAQRRGVDNITLFCLGTALLEIAYWKPVNGLREDYDNDNIDTVRRMSNGGTMLGKWYDAAIRKCLRCDFAFGSDLRQVELQRAVYSEVIRPLEDLIAKLENLKL
jgi:hypothetical protein